MIYIIRPVGQNQAYSRPSLLIFALLIALHMYSGCKRFFIHLMIIWGYGTIRIFSQSHVDCTLGIPGHDTIYSSCLLMTEDKGYTFSQVHNLDFWIRFGRVPSGAEYQRREVYWLRGLLIRSPGHGDPGLIQLQNWSNIDLFVPDGHGGYVHQKSGLKVAPGHKSYPDFYNYFKPQFFDLDTLLFYARVHSDFPVFTLPLRQNFLLKHTDEKTFLQGLQQRKWFLLFQGFLLTQIILGLMLYLWLRQEILVYYVIINAGLLVYDAVGGPLRSFVVTFHQIYFLEYLLATLSPIIVAFAVLHFVRVYLPEGGFGFPLKKIINKVILWALIIRGIGLSTDYLFEVIREQGLRDQLLIAISNLSLLLWAVLCIILYGSIFTIPLIWLSKRISGSGLLFISVVVPALSAVLISVVQGIQVARHFTVPHFPYTIGYSSDGLGASAASSSSTSVYTWTQLGEFIFIVLVAIMIAIRARKTIIEKQQALESKATAEQQVSLKLLKINHLKDQFLANTSHELRTPLQGIIGLGESLQEQIKNPAQLEDLDLIIASGKRLSNLVNDLLDFSKLKHQEILLNLSPVYLSALTEIIFKHVRPLVKEKSLMLKKSIPPDFPTLSVDENRLQQILYNLIGNAIKFTEKGYIEVGGIFPHSHDLATIYVKDTGVGIPAEQMHLIFEEFVQGDESLTRRHGGTGLGLSITKRLVELHGGTMWCESQLGQGSTFYFTMPIAANDTVVVANSESESTEMVNEVNVEMDNGPAMVNPNPKATVLIVDDEAVVRRVLKNQLEQHHYLVIQATQGAEAIDIVSSGSKIDLILLDIMMPVMSGYEVCRLIREKYLPSELPIIMITAKDQVRDIIEGLSLGANDYLAKPFSKDELLARIRTQLDLKMVFDATGRFVPNEFLQALGRDRITEVSLGDFIQREVTVMFSDIRNYTSLAESMEPEENYRFVNAFHGRIGPLILQHHGFVNQYLGDGIMALFPSLPIDALYSAIAMQTALRHYNLYRISKQRRPLEIGIGLHTGPLIMGIIGDSRRMEAATIADAVNTASRLESLTKYYGAKILLSDDSYGKLATTDQCKLHFRYLGQVVVKGKIEPIGVYECLEGEDETQLELKVKTLESFQEAIALYFQRSFSRASVIFETILELNPNDRVVKLFLNKSGTNLAYGVPDDWNGVEKMLFK